MPVMIRPSLDKFGYDVVIHYDQPDGKYIGQVGDNGEMQFVKYETGSIIQPTFSIEREALQELVIAAQKLGIETESESTARGRLEAQSEHLLDLKVIVGWFMDGQKRVVRKMPNGGTFERLPLGGALLAVEEGSHPHRKQNTER